MVAGEELHVRPASFATRCSTPGSGRTTIRAAGNVAQECHDRPEAGVAVLLADRADVDEHHVRRTEQGRLVEAGGVVVEERDGAAQPLVQRSGQIAVTGQAIDDQLADVALVHRPRERITALLHPGPSLGSTMGGRMTSTVPARHDERALRDLTSPRHQALGSLLGRVWAVDAVGVEERAASLAKRSIKREAKLWALDLAIRMMDLTTLEGKDTPGKVRALAGKARRPDPTDPSIPSVAALCVYPNMIAAARDALAGSGVKVAAVSTYFPSGQASLEVKLDDVRVAVALGADEIDMVIDRGAFLTGDYARVFDEIVAVKEASGDAHLKVILETGELETYDNVRRASVLAMAAGADFIKTSTGKVQPAATLPVTLVMLEAIRDFHLQTGRAVGMKPAGGIRTSKEAIAYLTVLYETLGPDWMTPDRFRFGASSLLNDVLMQIRKERTGRYAGGDYFTLD